MNYSFSYILYVQYLGFRLHGWQKQPNLKTGHLLLDRTLKFILDGIRFKTLGVGRTDAKVSATCFAVHLFIDEALVFEQFLKNFNINAPADIRMLKVENVQSDFNIIQHSKLKEYHYYFSFGEKNHPFAAPFITGLQENLNIDRMKMGAQLFEGAHYFHKYCAKPSKNTNFYRTIDTCKIVKNDILTASFFPEKSYVLKVKGKGFLRYQIRFMMAVLFELGKGNSSLEFIENSLKEDNDRAFLKVIAPASGLQLYHLEFENL